MSFGGNVRKPGGKWIRLPTLNQLHQPCYQFVGKMSINIFAAANKIAPSGISPGTKTPSLRELLLGRNPAPHSEPGQSASRPLEPRSDPYFTMAEEAERALYYIVFGRCWQRGDIAPYNVARIAIQRPDQKLHMPVLQIHILLHLSLLF